ncbi:hypothetical protein SSAmo_1920 [Enterobacterales bacterium endosymbiont of Anomoneura mori]
MIVVDLGAAPGSWSKYAKKMVGTKGIVYSYDIKKINPINGINFFKENILNMNFIKKITNYIGFNNVQVVISDLSPKISGIASIDIPKSIELAKKVIKICNSILKKKGTCIIKIFQGNGFKKFIKYINPMFKKIKIIKPYSSRTTSKEVYIIAINYNF